jgi:DNA-binding NarL/FixJ family response regulator
VIRVLLADDQALLRAGFRMLLEAADDIEVCGEAPNGGVAFALARQHRPDVVLMDLRMPDVDGVTATSLIAGDPALAAVRVVVLTTFDDEESVFSALRAGASGFLVKDVEPDDLLRAVRVAARGEALLSPSVTRAVIEKSLAMGDRGGVGGERSPRGGVGGERSPRGGVGGEQPPTSRGGLGGIVPPEAMEILTQREREVVFLVAAGLSNDEIAARLTVSPFTAKTHVSRAMIKLGARDRAQLVVLAYEHWLASHRDPR